VKCIPIRCLFTREKDLSIMSYILDLRYMMFDFGTRGKSGGEANAVLYGRCDCVEIGSTKRQGKGGVHYEAVVRGVAVLLTLSMLVFLPLVGEAKEFQRGDRYVVPFGPGSGTDTTMRALAPELEKALVSRGGHHAEGSGSLKGMEFASSSPRTATPCSVTRRPTFSRRFRISPRFP
jgi:hypothetical protein